MSLDVQYQPPCWVNPTLQKRLLSPVKNYQDFCEIGKQLWEASAGENLGFEEFKKYSNSQGTSTPTEITKTWKSFFPPDNTCSSFTLIKSKTRRVKKNVPKSPLSPTAAVFSIRKSCGHCKEIFIPQEHHRVCSSCFHSANIVANVYDSVFN